MLPKSARWRPAGWAPVHGDNAGSCPCPRGPRCSGWWRDLRPGPASGSRRCGGSSAASVSVSFLNLIDDVLILGKDRKEPEFIFPIRTQSRVVSFSLANLACVQLKGRRRPCCDAGKGSGSTHAE